MEVIAQECDGGSQKRRIQGRFRPAGQQREAVGKNNREETDKNRKQTQGGLIQPCQPAPQIQQYEITRRMILRTLSYCGRDCGFNTINGAFQRARKMLVRVPFFMNDWI